MPNQTIAWPSAVVALGILALIAAIEVAAIARYDAGDAIKIWGLLGTLVGVVTGAFVTYFFTKGAADSAKKEAGVKKTALEKIAERVDHNQFEVLKQDPDIAAGYGPA